MGANIHKKVVFSDELSLDTATSTTEDKRMDCEAPTQKQLKPIKPLGSSLFNRSQSLDWVKEYKQEGIEPLTNVDQKNLFGNEEELTSITPDGLPKAPSLTISKFTELKEESDVELEPKTIQPSNIPLNIPRSVPSSADTIKKESKKVTTKKEYTDLDVLFGRGGRGNHHEGNKRYRSLVNSHKEQYRKIKDKQAK